MKRIALSIVIVSIFGIVSCKQSSQPGTTGTNTQHKGGGIPFTAQWGTTGNLAATFQIDNNITHYPDSTSSSGSESEVYLWDSASSVAVSGGTVTINGTSIPTMDHTADGDGLYYMLNSGNGQTVPMLYNGSQLIFAVSGNSNFAALKDTIAYVNKQVTISSPALYDSLSASAGFTITWPHNSGSTDTMSVELIGDTSYYVKGTPDNGTFSVTPTMLTGFSTGSQISVIVTRITYKYATASDGRQYVMACYSAENDIHGLKP